MPRMNILNKSEQEKFNTPPIFTSFERKQFFTLPKTSERDSINITYSVDSYRFSFGLRLF